MISPFGRNRPTPCTSPQTSLFASAILGGVLMATQSPVFGPIFPQFLAFLGLFVLIGLRLAAGREAMSRVWLSWGNGRNFLLFGPAIVEFYVLQVVLNALFGLGSVHPSPLAAPPGLNPDCWFVMRKET